MLGLALLALLPLAAGSLDPRGKACNNSPNLCSKSFGKITQLGAHDSPFLRNPSTNFSIAGNQYYDTPAQLDAGVRLVTAQVHRQNDELRLCHTSCELLDAGTLQRWLSSIKTWLDSNPNDVVTILLVNSASASASDLDAEFQSAGIVDYAYQPASQSAPSSWPTLHQLIHGGTRLVTFIASLDDNAAAPYLMNEFTYIFENPYDVSSPSDFSCTPDRPASLRGDLSSALSSNRLPLMNHFLYVDGPLEIEYPNASYAPTTNAPSGGIGNLGDTARKCTHVYNRQPAFILVDFFNKGPAIATVDRLNGVDNPVGRIEANQTSSAAPTSSTSSTGSGSKTGSVTETGSHHTASSTSGTSTGAATGSPSQTGAATRDQSFFTTSVRISTWMIGLGIVFSVAL